MLYATYILTRRTIIIMFQKISLIRAMLEKNDTDSRRLKDEKMRERNFLPES